MSEDGVAAENRVETALINDLDPEAISAVAARSRKNVITYISKDYQQLMSLNRLCNIYAIFFKMPRI